MSITRSRTIDVEAEKILRTIIPNEWLIRKQDPDFHIDFRIEIAQNDPSGQNFCVQLKGREQPRMSGGFIVQPMMSKHLAYYVDKVKDPVFLFLAHTATKKVYWLFLQKHLLDLPTNGWRNCKSYSLKVPLLNEIRDPHPFAQVVKQAELFMRDLWPSSIKPAVDFHQKQLNEIDPRFSVSIGYANGQTLYHILPKLDVKVNFRLKDAHAHQDGLRRLFSHGEPICVPHSALTVDGSPLLEHLIQQNAGEVKLSFNKRLAVDVVAKVLGEEPGLVHGFKAEISGGQTHFTLEMSLPRSPLRCRISLFSEDGRVRFSGQMGFSLSFDAWNGCRVSELPFVQQITALIAAFRDGSHLQFDVSSGGRTLFPVHIAPKKSTQLSELHRYLVLLGKLCRVCEYFTVDYLFDEVQAISNHDAALIHGLCDFIDTGRMRLSTPNATASATLVLTAELLKSLRENRRPVDSIGCKGRDYHLVLLGRKVTIENAEYELQNMWLLSDLSMLSEKQIGGEYTMHWSATDSTTATIRICSESTMSVNKA